MRAYLGDVREISQIVMGDIGFRVHYVHFAVF